MDLLRKSKVRRFSWIVPKIDFHTSRLLRGYWLSLPAGRDPSAAGKFLRGNQNLASRITITPKFRLITFYAPLLVIRLSQVRMRRYDSRLEMNGTT